MKIEEKTTFNYSFYYCGRLLTIITGKDFITTRLKCNSWSCPSCREEKFARYENAINTWWPIQRLYVSYIPDKPRAIEILRRKNHRQIIGVRTGEGQIFVISGQNFENSKRMSKSRIFNIMKEYLFREHCQANERQILVFKGFFDEMEVSLSHKKDKVIIEIMKKRHNEKHNNDNNSDKLQSKTLAKAIGVEAWWTSKNWKYSNWSKLSDKEKANILYELVKKGLVKLTPHGEKFISEYPTEEKERIHVEEITSDWIKFIYDPGDENSLLPTPIAFNENEYSKVIYNNIEEVVE